MRYKIFKDRIKLYDSYTVSKKQFEKELKEIRTGNPDCLLWIRTIKSMKCEWAAHNLAYLLHINREKTKDCDLNFEQSKYLQLLYWIFGNIAFLFIK